MVIICLPRPKLRLGGESLQRSGLQWLGSLARMTRACLLFLAGSQAYFLVSFGDT